MSWSDSNLIFLFKFQKCLDSACILPISTEYIILNKMTFVFVWTLNLWSSIKENQVILIKAALCQFTYHTGKLSVCVSFFRVSLSVSSICPFVSVCTFEFVFPLRSMSFASVCIVKKRCLREWTLFSAFLNPLKSLYLILHSSYFMKSFYVVNTVSPLIIYNLYL